ncbi:hypothetical protein [Enterococcus sp. AZ180]|uniref:hypothetical protein n=1 Tax=Enterococcus sp. AZ180 TaxID=2774961 RepID=UPI003F27F4A3
MKVLALTADGEMTYCSAAPEMRGKGRCNHVDHQKEGEPVEDFINRINSDDIKDDGEIAPEETGQKLGQEQIDSWAEEIDKIAGVKVTEDNFEQVLSNLDPEKVRQITKIAFGAAEEFELPITDEEYVQKELDNKIYFANMPDYGIAGKQTSIDQMFRKVGEMPGIDGKVNIESNYLTGLTPDEYFEKQFSARSASIAKSVSTSLPGYSARKLFYGLSDVCVAEDCGGDHSKGILGCKVPGSICSKCAKNDGLMVDAGHMIGGRISTNLSERLTQLVMKQFHPIASEQIVEVI